MDMVKMNENLQNRLKRVSNKYKKDFSNYNFKLEGRWVNAKNKKFAIILNYNDNKNIEQEEIYCFKVNGNEKVNLEYLSDSLIQTVLNEDNKIKDSFENIKIKKVS